MQLGTRRHHATYGDLQPVVEEAFGKLERIVGMGLTRTIERLIDTEGEVKGAQGIARDAADLAIEERAQSGVHGEGLGITISQIHTRSQHGNSQLASLLDTQGLQLAMQLHIFGSIEGELQSHVLQSLGDDDATVEIDTTPYPIVARYGSFSTFGGSNVQRRIHQVARELNIRTILDGKRLQRNDGQRVFHLTIGEGITTRQTKVVGRTIGHAQRTTTHKVDEVGMVGIEVGHDMGSVRYFKGHIHRESSERRTRNNYLSSITKVLELHQVI